jgi:hypothetical protein
MHLHFNRSEILLDNYRCVSSRIAQAPFLPSLAVRREGPEFGSHKTGQIPQPRPGTAGCPLARLLTGSTIPPYRRSPGRRFPQQRRAVRPHGAPTVPLAFLRAILPAGVPGLVSSGEIQVVPDSVVLRHAPFIIDHCGTHGDNTTYNTYCTVCNAVRSSLWPSAVLRWYFCGASTARNPPRKPGHTRLVHRRLVSRASGLA